MKTTLSPSPALSLAIGLGCINISTAANLALYEFVSGSAAATSSATSVTATTFLVQGADLGQDISSFSETAFIRGRVTPATFGEALTADPLRYFEASITATDPTVNLGSIVFSHLASNATAENWVSRFTVVASLDGFSSSTTLGTSSFVVPSASGTITYGENVQFTLAPMGASISTGQTLSVRVYAHDPTIASVDEGNLISRFDNFRFEDEFIDFVPEPSTMLFGLMGLGFAAFRRRPSA